MATARPTLSASRRDVTGKKVAHLRSAGSLPAVVFGRGLPSENVQVDSHQFELLRRHTTGNTLIDLSVDGDKARPVLVHGVQVHPVTRRPVHADLFLVRMTEEITVDVPLAPIGASRAIDDDGGTLNHPTETIRIRALPDHLPEVIEYSIDSLVDFDAAIHVRDLVLPGDVTLLTDADEVVAKVLAPRVEVEEAPAAEAEEGAEGEAAESEGETGAAGTADGSASADEGEAGSQG